MAKLHRNCFRYYTLHWPSFQPSLKWNIHVKNEQCCFWINSPNAIFFFETQTSSPIGPETTLVHLRVVNVVAKYFCLKQSSLRDIPFSLNVDGTRLLKMTEKLPFFFVCLHYFTLPLTLCFSRHVVLLFRCSKQLQPLKNEKTVLQSPLGRCLLICCYAAWLP